MNKIIIIVTVALIAICGFGIFMMDMSYDNEEVKLRTKVNAQEEVCKSYFDKMWKVLQQQAGVADQYKQAFKDIYPALIEGRYSKGDGSLMKWITESNPEFDASMYKKLMNSIEIQREGFFNEQKTLIDINAQHKMLLGTKPSKWFIDEGIKPIDIKLITSSATNKTYETGEENDVDLFKKETPAK